MKPVAAQFIGAKTIRVPLTKDYRHDVKEMLKAGGPNAGTSPRVPARSVANVRCGGTTRLSNIMHSVFLCLLVSFGSGALAHIPMAALGGVTAWMGLNLLDVSAWRRMPRMRLVDSSAFLVTAFGVMVTNAVAAVAAGCLLYALHALLRRYRDHGHTLQSLPSVAK